jgi:hypothetical protein
MRPRRRRTGARARADDAGADDGRDARAAADSDDGRPGGGHQARARTPSGATTRAAVPGAATPPPRLLCAHSATAHPPSKANLAQAATLLSEAQGLIQTGSEAGRSRQDRDLRASFGGTPPARDGALLAARTHHAAKRYDDAAALDRRRRATASAPRRSAKA